MQARLVVVDEDRGRDVHGVAEHEALLDAALGNRLFDLRRDVHKTHPLGHVEGEVVGVGLHLD